MITRQYYGILCDRGLITRGDYQRIADICNEKGLTSIENGKVDRNHIQRVVAQGADTSIEVSNEIVLYFFKKQQVQQKQEEFIKEG